MVPVDYRTPTITIEQARPVALKEHTRMLSSGRRLGGLDAGFDDMLWWTFEAADLDAIDHGLDPGCARIAVDKLSGHLRTAEEYRTWLCLSADEA